MILHDVGRVNHCAAPSDHTYRPAFSANIAPPWRVHIIRLLVKLGQWSAPSKRAKLVHLTGCELHD